jgi:hypothetical protein
MLYTLQILGQRPLGDAELFRRLGDAAPAGNLKDIFIVLYIHTEAPLYKPYYILQKGIKTRESSI